jgi:TolB protein
MGMDAAAARGAFDRRAFAGLFCVLAFAAFLAAYAFPSCARATVPGSNGRLTFDTYRDNGFAEIYTMNADGSSLSRLTNNSADDIDPVWSPDTSKIAFESRRDGNSEVYVMNADGTGQVNLTNRPGSGFAGFDAEPAWSPDGTKIAFRTYRDGSPAQAEIYVMNADGTNPTRLTNNAAVDGMPDWSPDGTKIAFWSLRSGNGEVWVANADGSGVATDLTNNSGQDQEPAWSPDGTKIAFTSERDGNRELFVMNADGTGQTQLTSTAAGRSHDSPRWSPDGTKIVFTSNRDGPSDLYAINPDGSGLVRITTNGAINGHVDWGRFASYTTPSRASPIHDSLVPSFKQCGTGANPATMSHSAPLSLGSCDPVPTAAVARIGAQSVSSATLTVVYGDVTTPANEADVAYSANLTDIRDGSTTGPDYNPSAGGPDLTVVARFRLSDTANGPSGTGSGTTTDFDFTVPIDCSSTPDPAVGSTCGGNTSINAVTPGTIVEGRHTVIQTFRVRMNDSGVNGVRGDSDDTLFVMGGFYVP